MNSMYDNSCVYSFFIIKPAVSKQLHKIVLEGALLHKNSSIKYLIAKNYFNFYKI